MPTAEELAAQLAPLPTLPDVALRVQEMLADPNCELSEVGALIGRDPVLAGKLARIANSSLYGGGDRTYSLLARELDRPVLCLAERSGAGLVVLGQRPGEGRPLEPGVDAVEQLEGPATQGVQLVGAPQRPGPGLAGGAAQCSAALGGGPW